MTEFNSNSFLIELDSFGKPPPPQKIYANSQTKEIASKLDAINMEKQKKIKGDFLIPSNNGMVKLASDTVPKRQQINQDDARRWRDDVLAMNRPKAPSGTETAETAREYAKQIRNSTYLNHSDSEDERTTRSSSASNSLPSPPGELSSPYLKIRTDIRHERKSSDYSSASSHKSPSPPSQSSYSDYASLYKSQTNSPSPRPESPTKQFNAAFRNSGSVPVVNVKKEPRFSPIGVKSDHQKTPNFGYGPSLTQQVRVTAKLPPPAGRAPGFSSLNGREEKRKETWKRIGEESDAQDRRLEELSRQLHQDLVMEKKREVGNCAHCQKAMYDTEDRYTVQENTFHSKCFCCEVCGKELKDQQFYLSGGRFYCKQDYFTEQMVQQRETFCAACKSPIQDAILSALNRNYHPKCFRCTDCHRGLDGTPFSADKGNQPFCLPCYHNRYAPRCATCKQPITPDAETGETTRIVASKNSYHVECYVCEGCRRSFDEEEKCYPLDGHLLCRTCHLHWARTKNAPITDL